MHRNSTRNASAINDQLFFFPVKGIDELLHDKSSSWIRQQPAGFKHEEIAAP